MAADGKLIILSEKGELVVAEASAAEFKPLARAQVLGGKCWATPVLANGRIYCRNAAGIWCVWRCGEGRSGVAVEFRGQSQVFGGELIMRTVAILMLLVSAMLCGGAVGGAEYETVFARTPDLRPPYFSSTFPEMIKQRRAQFQAILERIHLVDQGKGAAGFGAASNGLQLALIVLEPELASTQRVHSAIVLRNDSSEQVGYRGDTTEVFEIIAVDEAGQPLPRTPTGRRMRGVGRIFQIASHSPWSSRRMGRWFMR